MFAKQSILIAAILSASAYAQNASAVLNATAVVTGAFGVTGTFNFLAPAGTEEVTVTLSVDGLSTLNSSTNYIYHIHTHPVPSNGNCTGTLAHLDPLAVSEQIVCDPTQPQFCQEGDLSGKFGMLDGSLETFTQTYQDPFLRFYPQPFSILGRSVTVHFPNKTRIACGNITSVLDGTADASGAPTNASSTYVTSYPPAPPAPANATTLTPFLNGATNTTALALATIPASLPNVNAVPNVILTTSTTLTTIGSSSFSTAFPVAVAASTSFAYSSGAALPTQSVATVSSATTAPATGSGGSTAAPSSTSTRSGSGSVKVAYGLAFGAVAAAVLLA